MGCLVHVCIALALLAACDKSNTGVHGDGGVDTAPPGPCWPYETSAPKGEIELGTGDDGSPTFAPMPDDIALEFGPQNGFDIPTRTRIRGLDPGDPTNILNSTNPRTRLRIFLANGNLADQYGTCPNRLGYTDDGAGAFTIQGNLRVMFFECFATSQLFEQQFRLQAEVIDSTGGYAKVEKLVTVHAPAGWPDAGPPVDPNPACPPTVTP
ncbi:hypothetical protein BH11MYX1_BH11MYX1_45880 [soil metagenome]